MLTFAQVNVILILFGTGAILASIHALSRNLTGNQKAADGLALIPLWRGARTGLAQIFPWVGATGVAVVIPGMWALFLVFLEDRLDRVWQRLRFIGIFARRSGGASRVGHGRAIGGCSGYRAGDAGATVFTTATFLGYLLRGPVGAVVATIGIFLPAFILVAVSGPLIPLLRRSATAGAFLDGVNVASLALMAAVSYQLGRSAIVDWVTIGLAIASAVLLLRFRINSAWLVLRAGAVIRWYRRTDGARRIEAISGKWQTIQTR